MEKHLQTVGNSFCVVIDKPLLKVLGLGRGSIVKLSTDGRRIIVERVDQSDRIAPSADPRLALDAPGVVKALLNRFQLSFDEFKHLHHQRCRPTRYTGWLSCAKLEQMTEAELTTMRRLEKCLAECQAGASKADAIARALAAHPIGDRE